MSWLERIVDRRAWLRCLAPLGASFAVLLGACAESRAQAQEEVRGTVERLTTAPRGEIDGAVLDDGTVLHWPPHLEDQFKDVAAVGDKIEATGRTETAPRGEVHFEVARVTNLRTNATVENDDRRPPPPGRRGPRPEPRRENRRAETARGVVRSLTTAPRGEIDGALLDDGTALHWPPHLEDQFRSVAAVGDKVEATGQTETGKRGEIRFEVARVTNLRTNAAAVNDDRRPPKGPKGPKGRGPRRGPRFEDREVTTAQGVVRSLTTAPRGEIDGALLDDGTALHWPPHLEDQFKDIAAVGDKVEATGSTETGKRGEVRFEVLHLTNLQTKASADNDRGRAAPPRGRPAGRDEQLRALEEQVRQLQREIDRLRGER
jgi:hypothetical protein